VLVSVLVWGLLVTSPGGSSFGMSKVERKGGDGIRGGGREGNAKRYFYRPWADLWSSDLLGGLSGFVLTWTVAFNLCGA